MRVFVTGGTGALGRPTVAALVAAGHTVSALARSPAKAGELASHGATPVQESLFDTPALTRVLAGHDAVVNLASALPSMTRFMTARAWEPCQRIRTEGSAAVVDAALAAGVGTVVQESVAMLYRSRGSDWIDEDAPVDHYPITRGNHAAEASAHRFGERGGTGIVLRLGWFYGPGAAHSEQMFAQAQHHIALMLGPADGYVSTIHVADGARAVVAALGAGNGVYNVVDDEPLTQRGFADAMCAAAGKRPWVRGPGKSALLFGERLTSLTRSLRVSNAKLRKETGWAPEYPSAREGWLATAAALRSG